MPFFDRFAERTSQLASRAWFFAFCVGMVVVWAPSLPLFGKVDTWQLVINTATTIITFLLVALLQNSQWRGDKATNEKLNALADSLSDLMLATADLIDQIAAGADKHDLRHEAEELRKTVGIEEQVSSTDDSQAYVPEAQRASADNGSH